MTAKKCEEVGVTSCTQNFNNLVRCAKFEQENGNGPMDYIVNKLENLLFAEPVYQQHKCTHKCVAGDGEARCKRHPEDNLYGNFAEHTWKVVKKENGQGKKSIWSVDCY